MPIGLLSETGGNKEEEGEACGFVTNSLFVAQRGSHFQATLCYSGPESLTVHRRKLLAIYCQG